MNEAKAERHARWKKMRDKAEACYWCGKPFIRHFGPDANFAPSIEHFIPKAHGGSNAEANIVVAHNDCNTRRGTKLPTRAEIARYLEVKGAAGKVELRQAMRRIASFVDAVRDLAK